MIHWYSKVIQPVRQNYIYIFLISFWHFWECVLVIIIFTYNSYDVYILIKWNKVILSNHLLHDISLAYCQAICRLAPSLLFHDSTMPSCGFLFHIPPMLCLLSTSGWQCRWIRKMHVPIPVSRKPADVVTAHMPIQTRSRILSYSHSSFIPG